MVLSGNVLFFCNRTGAWVASGKAECGKTEALELA